MSILTLPLLKAGLTAQVLGQNTGGYSVLSGAGLGDPQLADLLDEMSGLLEGSLGWNPEAHHVLEPAKGRGANVLYVRQYPIATMAHVNLLYPGTGTQQSVDIYQSAVTINQWDIGEILFYNPFILPLYGYLSYFPYGAPLTIDYVAGYVMTALAGGPYDADATSLTVANPLGIRAGADYRINDPTNGTETVTVAGTYTAGSTTVPLAAGTLYAHTTTTALAFTDMPAEVVRVVRRAVERRVLGRDSHALAGLKSRITGETQKLQESYTEVLELTPADLTELASLNRRLGVA